MTQIRLKLNKKTGNASKIQAWVKDGILPYHEMLEQTHQEWTGKYQHW